MYTYDDYDVINESALDMAMDMSDRYGVAIEDAYDFAVDALEGSLKDPHKRELREIGRARIAKDEVRHMKNEADRKHDRNLAWADKKRGEDLAKTEKFIERNKGHLEKVRSSPFMTSGEYLNHKARYRTANERRLKRDDRRDANRRNRIEEIYDNDRGKANQARFMVDSKRYRQNDIDSLKKYSDSHGGLPSVYPMRKRRYEPTIRVGDSEIGSIIADGHYYRI